eukprot:CAMPEP_0205921364 /NCGR_PEP_ID=MMETSP1325-20131115/12725_1 /ASSEMBLY_ACC=CAM_ASM_000708 /TAXON_ID=236786 /ORGANISM="Florenciella sp., Strain RCC1007" /LENGTH=49 /DNA_ID= /DNA_START= /DNA_END= /DNA_ORIENTATION=
MRGTPITHMKMLMIANASIATYSSDLGLAQRIERSAVMKPSMPRAPLPD